mmetsp:Transcript_19745/g.40200  ORF Transcript_19745/g.40200 Transcript_19745/m.40200 type:complete len:491 (-) Transcript_19745:22-1494(-)
MPHPAEHADVIIVGAGISGLGAAYRLSRLCPRKTYVVLEAREDLGGTWDVWRYPGVRSDSAMFTFAYPFKLWKSDVGLASGSEIKAYLRKVAAESGVDRHIRCGHRVNKASWSSAESKWSVETAGGSFTCSFLYLCTGYYEYDEGYIPDFTGLERFSGRFVHPIRWPEDLDYSGKHVVVIGSGATTISLVPELAKTAKHVTMLQRSPSYLGLRQNKEPLRHQLLMKVSPSLASRVARWKHMYEYDFFYRTCKAAPKLVKDRLIEETMKLMPGQDERHFTPKYDPWDERLCAVKDGDFFEAVNNGRVSVVTDSIDCFTESGIPTASGQELEADIIVSATGFNMKKNYPVGGINLTVDGAAYDKSRACVYRGCMVSEIPNLVFSLGYANASWTLRSDLVAVYVCKLLKHMDQHGFCQCRPGSPDSSVSVERLNWGLKSGYWQRGSKEMPLQGDRSPWTVPQSSFLDRKILGPGAFDDGILEFAGNSPVMARL